MGKSGILITGLLLSTLVNTAVAESEGGHVYLGLGVTSLALDDDRIVGEATRSPGHSPKVGSLFLGYQFNDLWATDISLGTDFSSNADTDQFSINGYRFFGEKKWKPYASAGFSNLSVDDATIDDNTGEFQAGVGVSGTLSDKIELRVGYQHFFEMGGESYDDDGFTIALNWHFRKPKPVVVAQAAPEPAPAPVPVPVQKEVIDRFELLVEFDFDKSEVKSIYQPQFEEIARVLKENPEITMTIEGHTDWVGTEKYNQDLSERRASAVRSKFIQDYDFSPDRINSEGYGETQPIADNSTSAGRQKNRRAISVILRPRMVTE